MCDGRHVTAAVEDVRATCAVSYLETRVSLPFVVIYDNLVCLYLMRYSKMILHMLGFKI